MPGCDQSELMAFHKDNYSFVDSRLVSSVLVRRLRPVQSDWSYTTVPFLQLGGYPKHCSKSGLQLGEREIPNGMVCTNRFL